MGRVAGAARCYKLIVIAAMSLMTGIDPHIACFANVVFKEKENDHE
jgi:hypothetical protein